MEFDYYNNILSEELEKAGLDHEYVEGDHLGDKGLIEHRIIGQRTSLYLFRRKFKVARFISESINFPEEVEVDGILYDLRYLERRGINIEVRNGNYISVLENVANNIIKRTHEHVNLSFNIKNK